MKTESSLGTRSPVSSGKSVLEQLSASRTPAKAGRDAASSLSFRTLMADIRPGGFEEMTQRMAERRAEQQRLEKERQRERPRAEDLHGSAQVMQRPAAEPQRSRQTDEMRPAERVTKASRQAERATTTRSRDADNASARGASTAEARPASARAEEARPAAPLSTQAATRTAASESGSTSAPGDKVDADSMAAAATTNQTTAASNSAAAGAASAQATKAVDSQASTGSSKPTELATADVPAKSSSPSSSEDALADQVRQGAQVQMEASPISESELQQLARQMGLDESGTQDVSAPTEAQGTSADTATLTKDITAVDTGEKLSSGSEGTATVHPTMAMAPSRHAQAASASATQPAQDGRVAPAGRPSTSPALPQTSPASDAAAASRPTTTDTSPTPDGSCGDGKSRRWFVQPGHGAAHVRRPFSGPHGRQPAAVQSHRESDTQCRVQGTVCPPGGRRGRAGTGPRRDPSDAGRAGTDPDPGVAECRRCGAGHLCCARCHTRRHRVVDVDAEADAGRSRPASVRLSDGSGQQCGLPVAATPVRP